MNGFRVMTIHNGVDVADTIRQEEDRLEKRMRLQLMEHKLRLSTTTTSSKKGCSQYERNH